MFYEFSAPYSRTLVVDASTAQGGQLAEQLTHAGFGAEFAVNWHAARASLRAHHYHSCIVVADLGRVEDVKQLTELRRIAPSVWVIVLCDLQSEHAVRLARRKGADAVLSAPICMLDLTTRLAAFSRRSRPTF